MKRPTPVLLYEKLLLPKPAEKKKTCKIIFFPISGLSLTPEPAHSVHVLLHAASSGHSIPLHAESSSSSARILGKELHLLSQWPALKPRECFQACPRAVG